MSDSQRTRKLRCGRVVLQAQTRRFCKNMLVRSDVFFNASSRSQRCAERLFHGTSSVLFSSAFTCSFYGYIRGFLTSPAADLRIWWSSDNWPTQRGSWLPKLNLDRSVTRQLSTNGVLLTWTPKAPAVVGSGTPGYRFESAFEQQAL